MISEKYVGLMPKQQSTRWEKILRPSNIFMALCLNALAHDFVQFKRSIEMKGKANQHFVISK